MQRNKEFYSLFFDDMEKHGVNVLIENGCEINNLHYYLRTGMEMREFLDYANHPLLHACWDTGHAHMRNKEQYDCIKLLGDELYAVHINDNLGKSDSHIPPYFGSCNFDQVIQALLDIDFKRPFTFEVGNSLHNRRKEWIHNGIAINLLGQVPLHLKQQAVALVYQIGKYMLEQYDCFEE
jgi:sugar phosphate isomerase/epimerase